MTARPEPEAASRLLPYYIALVVGLSALVGVLAWTYGRRPEVGPLVLLVAMGVLSYVLREPDITSRIGFSFLSIIMLASGAILGPFGAWAVGLVSQLIERQPVRWFQRLFNPAMTSIVGASGALAYILCGGASSLEQVNGFPDLALRVGLPLMVADVVQCITNAVLLGGAISLSARVPFWVFVRRILTSSGVAYIGYGVIGFLFVVLWYPADLGAFSALLVMAPLLAARWAFVQFGEEQRSHERVVETLVTALGTKEPRAMRRSETVAQLAEWTAEELGLGPRQIATVTYAARLHEIGHLGVPTRLLRRDPSALTESERRVVERHIVTGARMIEGIDFLEEARSGVRHQSERFDGHGLPDGLAGEDIPIAARVVAVASAAAAASSDTRASTSDGALPTDLHRTLAADAGRYDPTVLEAARAAMAKHGLPTGAGEVTVA